LSASIRFGIGQGYFDTFTTPNVRVVPNVGSQTQKSLQLTVPVIDQALKEHLGRSKLQPIADGFDGQEKVYAMVPTRVQDERGYSYTRNERVLLPYVGGSRNMPPDGRKVDLHQVSLPIVDGLKIGSIDMEEVRARGISFEMEIGPNAPKIELDTWSVVGDAPPTLP
jgi:hypothetical protein